MKLSIEQLERHAEKSLLPIYLISGDEPLLVEETLQTLRNIAHKKEFNNREVWHVESNFNWQSFLQSSNNLSLFSEKTLLELRIPSGKLNEKNKTAILEYINHIPSDKLLLLIMQKLDKAAQSTKWFKAINAIGAFIPIWPVSKEQLPRWIENRLEKIGMTADPIAIRYITENTEGNLLATKQLIEKLQLTHDKTHLTIEDITQTMHDNARYDVFTLVDDALAGQSQRVLKILETLQAEAIEPTIILWALAREIRNLITMAEYLEQGESIEQTMRMQFVWEKRKPMIRAALTRHTTKSLYALLQKASHIDRIIKGVKPGNIWDQLSTLSTRLSMA